MAWKTWWGHKPIEPAVPLNPPTPESLAYAFPEHKCEKCLKVLKVGKLFVAPKLCSSCRAEAAWKSTAIPIEEELPSSMMVYLTQWLKTATKSRVRHSHAVHSVLNNNIFHVFKCDTCGGTRNVSQSLFGPGTGVPSDLQAWVKEHRHVCSNFVEMSDGDICLHCSWAKSEHGLSEAEIVNHQPYYEQKVKEVAVNNAIKIKILQMQADMLQKAKILEAQQTQFATAPVKEVAIVEEHKGRRFR